MNIIKWSTKTDYCIFLVLDLRTDELLDLLINQSYPVIFKCEAIGEPVPTISWNVNCEEASDDCKYNISTLVSGSSVVSSLTIKNAQSSDVGIYTCTASNVIHRDRFAVLTANSKHLCCMYLFSYT